MSQMIDPKFFKPFIDGTIETLKVQCRIEVKPEKPFIKGSQKQPTFDIAGVIALSSNTFVGSITLCFPKKLYLALMGNMLGETYTEINQELSDGAAELLNIVFGSAKRVLNREGHTIQKAIPTVVLGDSIRTKHLGDSPVVVIPFSSPQGELHIEISREPDSLQV